MTVYVDKFFGFSQCIKDNKEQLSNDENNCKKIIHNFFKNFA
jgi:hypothetical protein